MWGVCDDLRSQFQCFPVDVTVAKVSTQLAQDTKRKKDTNQKMWLNQGDTCVSGDKCVSGGAGGNTRIFLHGVSGWESTVT